MFRRTFLASLPATALATKLLTRKADARAASTGAGTGGAAPEAGPQQAADKPKFWPKGKDRFVRYDVRAGDRPVGATFASRTAVYGTSGACGSAHPYATMAGLDILKKGGSAVDAAVAINACLGFLEPTSSGIGGDCFAMVWDPKVGKLAGLAGSGGSPMGLSLETVRRHAKNGAIPALGPIAVSVPGALDAWWTLHQRYGKLPWAEVLQPAIDYAENGVPVPDVIAYYIRRNMAIFKQRKAEIGEIENAFKTYAPNGVGPATGGMFRNPDLARTYRMIARGGRDAFYDGPIADTIDAYFRRIGGWLRKSDLQAMHSEWVQPYTTDYRGVTVHALGANTQGIATLQMLNMLEHFDLRGEGFQSPRSIHLQVEAKRLAYEDRARYYADPHFSKVPVEWLISKEYAAKRAALIKPDSILTPVYPGHAPDHAETTYFSAADKDGMMVSMIQSNFRGMGSGLVADGLGFMFQDRGQLFSLKDGHPNIYAPGKRPFQTIIPGFASIKGVPWMAFGVMGGDMQPQGQTQIIVNRKDYGLEIQSAADSPRWHHEGSSQSMGEDAPGLPKTGLLRLETGIPAATRSALADMGWTIGEPDGGFGRYECVENRHEGDTRIYAAASEMRADGCALAY
ncbi:gamma-glutamyltransferase [Stakelama sediminis]|uniref:Gamma-glutamyltranspeptidase/glutathione hydrolase n=1 Tax=Stakelama sediminis TaxID=463200 RepID=A0A840YWZ2_9SPHN|nr:gamma-glutamyltransferase family protein [Stakelama sediminis]MBB5718054.1 gamma-glutamyltranspeptidase/glutathione hydrolase [Stakelama sediminis]